LIRLPLVKKKVQYATELSSQVLEQNMHKARTEHAQNLHRTRKRTEQEQEQYKLKIAVKTAGGCWTLFC